MKPCPFCGETIILDAVKCRFCNEFVDDPDVNLALSRMSKYEREAYRDILKWEHQEQGIISQATDMALAPLQAVMGAMVPQGVVDGFVGAIQKGLEAVQDAATFTYSKESILEFSRSQGLVVKTVQDFKSLDLRQLDLVAASYMRDNHLLAFMEGFGCGVGGFALILADVPALMGINLRVLAQLCYVYGEDAELPREREYMLNCLHLASTDQATKASTLHHLNGIALAVAKKAPWRELEKSLLVQLIKKIAQALGIRLTKRKLLQLIPILGGAVGAGMNYHFTKSTAESGYMCYRKRYLIDKYLPQQQ